MPKYPLWKYLLILVVLIASAIYSLPNIFGDTPTVLVAAQREGVKLDAAMQTKIDAALKSANIASSGSVLENNGIKVSFADTDTQFKARDEIVKTVGVGHTVALNLESKAPKAFSFVGARPMSLGLDLRGGVHFLLQVDIKKATEKAFSRYQDEIRLMLRDNKLYYSSIDRIGTTIVVKFKEQALRDKAAKDIAKAIEALTVTESNSGGEFLITATVKADKAKAEVEAALDQNIQTLRKRVNELGVAEPIIQKQGSDRIIVEVPGAQNPAQLKEVIGRVATLDVRMVAEEHAAGDGQQAFEAFRNLPAPPGTDKFFDKQGFPVLVYKQSVITGDRVKNAQPNFDGRDGLPVVDMKLDEAGGNMMLRATKDRVGKRMAMMLIEKDRIDVLTWPRINDVLGFSFIITGMNSSAEAKELSLLLRAGALAAPMEFIEERVVGPSLGKENIEKGFKSVAYGFAAIAVFMVFYYLVFGIVSVGALAANLLILIAILSGMQATVTLPGIAAIALALGMAIDSNVLINERIREELRSGLSPAQAIEIGYDRAFDTILDSNITTLIAGLALLAFGSGPVRGFAMVHCIGILTSLFSAVVISKGLVHLIYGRTKKLEKISIGNTKWSGASLPAQTPPAI